MIEDLWYKNAVIRNLETFINASGVGNFQGLTRCLEYARDIAVKIR